MTRLTVRYFALFRERAGIDQEQLTTEATTALELFHSLAHRHQTDDPRGHCKVAINDVMADWDSPLHDNDIVLLFPPVAGG
ncbi:MAG: MoaD/ThiS family protein [Pseudomonadota bacterium]